MIHILVEWVGSRISLGGYMFPRAGRPPCHMAPLEGGWEGVSRLSFASGCVHVVGSFFRSAPPPRPADASISRLQFLDSLLALGLLAVAVVSRPRFLVGRQFFS